MLDGSDSLPEIGVATQDMLISGDGTDSFTE